jgi:short subunit dehydrogenase-like uncharacterized protein
VTVVVCDTNDQGSLEAMAAKAKVVLNCVGPYRFHGEKVVEACLKSGAHHLDISGEPAFLEKVQLKFHDEAKDKGLYVVGSCGFDSIPCDMGQVYLSEKMGGDVNAIESFLKVKTPEGVSGPSINFATYESAIHGFAEADELKPLRKQLFPGEDTTYREHFHKLCHGIHRVYDYCRALAEDKSSSRATRRPLPLSRGGWRSLVHAFPWRRSFSHGQDAAL